MNPIPAIVSACGLKAKPKNPYEEKIGMYPVQYTDPKYIEFSLEHPELTLTEPQQPGSEIMVNKVWQHAIWDSDDWRPNKVIHSGIETREAYAPIQITKEAEQPICPICKNGENQIWCECSAAKPVGEQGTKVEEQPVKDAYGDTVKGGDYLNVQNNIICQVKEISGELYFAPYGKVERVVDYFRQDYFKHPQK